jgi:hypothetical protein
VALGANCPPDNDLAPRSAILNRAATICFIFAESAASANTWRLKVSNAACVSGANARRLAAVSRVARGYNVSDIACPSPVKW